MVSKKEKYLVSAQKFIERGQWDKALAEYAKVVQEDPKDARTWLKMAEVHAKRGANAEAAEIYMRTGDLYVEQGFAQKAVAVYKNVLKLSPAAVPAHLKVGALFNQLGLVSDAVQQFELAAAALQRLEKFTEASAALRQALDIQPDNVVLRVKLAESASQAGLIEEAVREFDKAADQLKAQGRADESLRVLERLIFLQPDNFTKARELAEAYIARGKPRLALSKLQACLNGDPRDPRILSLLARALEQLGQVPKAVSVLKELVHLCDDLGRTSERDAAVLRGLILDPTDSELLATSAQYKVRVAAGDAAIDVTPPPLARQGPAADTGARRGGSFDLSGVVVRSPLDAVLPSASGRVAAPVGIADSGKRDPFDSSQGVGGGVGSDVDRILAEADVFVKYGLLERAADHLMRVFDIEPEQREARERLIGVLQRLGRKEEAIWHTDILSQQGAAPAAPADADKSVPISVSLSPDEGLLPFEPLQISGPNRSLGVGSDEITIDDGDIDDPAAGMLTPPPSDGWSQDHVQEPIDVLSKDVMTEFDAEIRTGDVMTVIGTAQLEADGEADEDPASAFSDDIATITGDPEVVLAAFAAFDEEELSAELEAVSFFLDQSMLEEARALLHDLEGRFPKDDRIGAKLREVEAAEHNLANLPKGPNATPGLTVLPADSVATSRIVGNPTLGSTVIERPYVAERGVTPTPRMMVRHGGSSDSSTHADLAIAYKGMGLFDAAIGELKLLAEDEKQEVFALTTMGECFEAKSSFTEAIIRYKRALNCEQITPEENRLLYFLLGAAFEKLGDISEALYFYEKVLKRDPKFRDVDLKVAELRPRLVKRAR